MRAIDILKLLGFSQPIDIKNYLTFTAIENNSKIQLTKNGQPDSISLQYKLNHQNWKNYTIDDIISLNTNDKVLFRGTTSTFSKDTDNYYKFEMSGKINTSGQVDSLINWTNLTNYCYINMFSDCSSLITAPELPASTLFSYCYANMFQGCTNLIITPELSSLNLADYCYYNMFKNCTKLVIPPELPAKNLVHHCYPRMFQGCTSLSSAPELQATTLASACYGFMFYGCKSLTIAPELPAITLVSDCYDNMFTGCTSLSSITVDFVDWYDGNNTTNWVQNVASKGNFYCNSGLSAIYDNNHIPVGWTIKSQNILLKYDSTRKLGIYQVGNIGTIENPMPDVTSSYYDESIYTMQHSRTDII